MTTTGIAWRRDDDHIMLAEAVGKLASDFGPSYFLDHSRRREPTEGLWKAAGAAGYVGVNLPAEYGGGDMGIAELAVVLEESAAAGAPLMFMVVSSAICGELIAQFGSHVQRQRWLPRLAAGESVLAFAITEPDAGSNTHAISTTARRRGDGWVLNGQKYYITGADVADAMVVVARTGDAGGGRAELSLFIVDSDAAGLTRNPIPVAVTVPERQFQVHFDDVELDAERLIGQPGNGLRQVFAGLNPERIASAAVANGLARYALDRAVAYACTRQVWDVPIGGHQGIAHPLAESFIQVEQARLMTREAAMAVDSGRDAAILSNIAKAAAADAALLAIDRAMQVHGGNGLSEEYGIAEYWSLARFIKTAPVSREMILNHVAEHGLGLPKSY